MTGDNLRPGPRKIQEPDGSVLIAALRYAMARESAGNADVASWCGKTRATVERWLKGEFDVNVKAVLKSKRLTPHFVDYLYAWRCGELESFLARSAAAD